MIRLVAEMPPIYYSSQGVGLTFWGHTHSVYNILGECDTGRIDCAVRAVAILPPVGKVARSVGSGWTTLVGLGSREREKRSPSEDVRLPGKRRVLAIAPGRR
jgi:hypothetical protein